jgi:hypothetical protein
MKWFMTRKQAEAYQLTLAVKSEIIPAWMICERIGYFVKG